MSEVTRILNAIDSGDPFAADQLLPLVYDELRRLARQRLAQERPGLTLQATALVHEAYLRLAGGAKEASWDSRGHFFSAAAEAMRRILIEQARRKHSKKRGGGGAHRLPLEDNVPLTMPDGSSAVELLALDDALREFESIEPLRARVVKIHYFAGLSMQETADALGISLATAKRYWTFARSWLYGKIQGRQSQD
jgi:RNA polymerase sigma factor (TIGR02999 family)